MKPTDFITETSLIAQEADNMHMDHEVQMARADCYNAAQYAIQLHRLLKGHASLEGWVSEKITLANDYLRTVAEYLEHEEAHGEEDQMIQFSESAMDFAVESLINESKHEVGTKVKVPHKGKMVAGKVVRHDKGKPHGSPFYVVDIGEYESLTVPDHEVKNAGDDSVNETAGVTDYNPKSQGGTRKELLAKYAKSGSSKDAEAARKAGATQKELQAAKKQVKEDASAGGMGASSVAISMSGGSGKPGTGKPKKIGNAAKMKKVQVGKGVY